MNLYILLLIFQLKVICTSYSTNPICTIINYFVTIHTWFCTSLYSTHKNSNYVEPNKSTKNTLLIMEV